MTSYDDIIDLPHYEPKRHRRMPMATRAAQFAPFAALTGHDAAIAETARQTEKFVEPSPEEQQKMSREILKALERQSTVTITYFSPDPLKPGGEYLQISGTIKSIEEIDRKLILNNSFTIYLPHIRSVTITR